MKLLVIVGPTSSGKTSLGIELAKKFDGEIISADSRQVYERLDVGTGKDIPKDAQFNFLSMELGGYYLIDGVKVWGYDLADPEEEYSVSKYIIDAKNIINHIDRHGNLPIMVGGTGFYIKGVIDGIETAGVPKNADLRDRLKKYKADQLFEKLANIDPEKAASLNVSDKQNPRRLVRAIEVAQWKMKMGKMAKKEPLDADVFLIGLKVAPRLLEDRIRDRINKRLESGFDQEIEELILSGIGWENQSMQALGYRQWQDYLKGDITKQEAIEEWFISEKNYAKKQMTWFKTDPRINWFEQKDSDWKKEVLQLVSNWVKKDESTKD